jgi:isopentenyl diphosphate isomerase/L-lactate dehydrogenase-like FMN-dependent dehydrogenase
MRRLMNVESWRARASRRLPRVAFDHVDGGADDEVTMRRNRAAFADLALVPRVLRGVRSVSADVELFGQRLALPVLLAPTGNVRMGHPCGEVAAAKGASAAGTISVLSGFSSFSPQKVAKAVPVPQWFQLYLFKDRQLIAETVEQVERHGFSALVVTVDAPVAGNRERDRQNGLAVPLKITPRMAADAARRPRWLWQYWTGEPMVPQFASGSLTAARRIGELKSLAAYVQSTLNAEQSWDDIRWLRSVWRGPLLVKGILCAEDAQMAVDVGCDGVIVSNHGGRQLDSAPASVEMLPEVVDAVRGRAEVLVDSGIRRGTDVVKAISLGAKACLIGRPWWYGLIVAGEAGVKAILDGLHEEIMRTLRLMGVTGVSELSPEFLRRRPGSGWEKVTSLLPTCGDDSANLLSAPADLSVQR